VGGRAAGEMTWGREGVARNLRVPQHRGRGRGRTPAQCPNAGNGLGLREQGMGKSFSVDLVLGGGPDRRVTQSL